jgi:uncharacterized protein
MAQALPLARKDQPAAAAAHSRRCLATGAMRPKDELIRFVIAPDRSIVPDLAHNLPGRGLWVTAERDAIETAARKNLFAKAAGVSAKADKGLAETVAYLLKKQCLDLLGLARSAGIAVLGQPQVEAALKAGKLALLLIADDAAANGVGKVSSVTIPTVRCFTRAELGAALGYDQSVYAGLKSHGLTQKLQLKLAGLEKIAGRHHLLTESDSGIQ